MGRLQGLSFLIFEICFVAVIIQNAIIAGETISIPVDPLKTEYASKVNCKPIPSINSLDQSCINEHNCMRRVVDGLFSETDIFKLHQIAEKGMSTRENIGGPTILDINTGFIRDSMGLDNLFSLPSDLFSPDDFQHYGSIISKLRDVVMETFQVENIFFTAPTFITRIDATKQWLPQEVHDEYWHAHADRNNTLHYHYSGLLYMSTYGEDFTGGKVLFYDQDRFDGTVDNGATDLIVEPRRGRVVIFSSGHENVHRVEKVLTGTRHVLSFWFTCDPQKQFQIFLDGQAHVTFSKKIKQAILSKKNKR